MIIFTSIPYNITDGLTIDDLEADADKKYY